MSKQVTRTMCRCSSCQRWMSVDFAEAQAGKCLDPECTGTMTPTPEPVAPYADREADTK